LRQFIIRVKGAVSRGNSGQDENGREDYEPPYLFPDYRSTLLRAPKQLPVKLADEWFHRARGPVFGRIPVRAEDADLTRHHSGEPLGERIIITGRVTDSDGRAVTNTLVEVWQANAAGRYLDPVDDHPAPLDPNFTGAGRCLTDSEGRYRFVTIKPGAYPWRNHTNAWRPAHVHFSLFGPSLASRVVTQMYFPGDPLIPHDPILSSLPDPRGRELLISRFDIETTVPEWALGYRWDVVLRGRKATPGER
jgi:protocatechuate 3,4-dioxygenase beta subunit